MIILYLSERGEAEGRFPLFFQYLGGQGGVIGQGKKRGCWSFFLLVFAFLAPFSFSGYSLAFELEAHNMRFTLRVFFSHLPPRPSPLLCFSIITLLNPQRWHFDDERSRLQRDRHRRSCPPRRKVTLWTPRGITLVVLGAIDRFCRSWRRRRRTRRRRPNASSFFLLVGDRSNERRGKQTIP